MENALLTIVLAFLEGLGLILSPCILPILPIVLSGSLEGNKNRPLGIIAGFAFMFALFTFFSRKLVQYAGLDLSVIRHISFGLLILLALMMMSTSFMSLFSRATQRLAGLGSRSKSINNPQSGFAGGFLFGCLIGFIWTPCAGPILAAVIVQTVIQKTTFSSFLVVLSFGIGAGVPMLLIALFGRMIMKKLTFFKQRAGVIRKILGGIILASVALMIYNDTYSGNTFSEFNQDNTTFQNALIPGVETPYPMPAITGITDWINSKPLTANDLKGKVVLIDFWTYSCINCVRTLPYIKNWYAKYHDKGLVIIGVHTPEFDFEKNLQNVKHGVMQNGIRYPVALDNHFVTWQNFSNQYWPAHYLIDKNGNVVYQHFGEGQYDTTENNIRFLLGLDQSIKEKLTPEEQARLFDPQTLETYLGYGRSDKNNSPHPILKNKLGNYVYPKTVAENTWALNGKWTVFKDRIVSGDNHVSLKMHFRARKVFIVMGNSTQTPIKVVLRLNGVRYKIIMVKNHALYPAVTLKQSQPGIIELQVPHPGLELYTFTFGR